VRALRNEQVIPPDHARSFTTAQVNAVTTLDNISATPKFPPFGPGLTELHATAGSTVVVTMEDGTDLTVEMAADETRLVRVPIKAFKTASGGVVTAVCYWWHHPGPKDDKYSVTDVP
jgi:hypothetical protein